MKIRGGTSIREIDKSIMRALFVLYINEARERERERVD